MEEMARYRVSKRISLSLIYTVEVETAKFLRAFLEDICTVTRRILLELLITRKIDGTLDIALHILNYYERNIILYYNNTIVMLQMYIIEKLII